MVSDAGRSHRVILLIAASISASVGLGFCLSSETAAMIRSPASVLPAFSLKFKIQEFKMAKNGHGGKRAGSATVEFAGDERTLIDALDLGFGPSSTAAMHSSRKSRWRLTAATSNSAMRR